jgi:hypothetical protein
MVDLEPLYYDVATKEIPSPSFLQPFLLQTWMKVRETYELGNLRILITFNNSLAQISNIVSLWHFASKSSFESNLEAAWLETYQKIGP